MIRHYRLISSVYSSYILLLLLFVKNSVMTKSKITKKEKEKLDKEQKIDEMTRTYNPRFLAEEVIDLKMKISQLEDDLVSAQYHNECMDE